MKTLYVFRHGETDWNREWRFQGHLDIPINETGREQARSLIPKLSPHSLEAILSSDLSRAHETARIVSEGLGGLPVFTDNGLREAHLGDAQGLSLQEIELRFGGELVTRWRSRDVSDADVCYPGGETGTQVMTRVFAAMETFLVAQSYERVGIATHGGVIRRIMQRLLPSRSEPVPIPNGVLYLIQFNEETRVWSVDCEKMRL